MIPRLIRAQVKAALRRQAAAAIIGPRQVGKTTLALDIAEGQKSLYIDLESPEDRQKLQDPLLFLRANEDSLVILDEIHRMPELFQVLRGSIDQGRRKGKKNNRFLILGSASVDLLRQSGESLAGRIEYVDMSPFNVLETTTGADIEPISTLWLRGGFPDSYLADDNSASLSFRKSFIRTYLERDVAQFGPRIPAESLGRLWTMLAHNQGTLLNASRLATGLMISAPTVTNYIDLLSDLLLVRRLQPFHANVGKRMVKSPKVYVRDSGIVHALLGIKDFNEALGHPVVGASWEGFVIENLLAVAPPLTTASFYRTSAGAEIDLLLDLPGKHGGRWAIEIKRGLAASVDKGFYFACDDVKPDRKYVVYGGTDSYPLAEDITAIGLRDLMTKLIELF